MRHIPHDVTIISGHSVVIQLNILFPEYSTFAIQYLLIMITNGFTITEKLSDEAINQIRETAQLLSIDIGELKHGKTVPSSVNTNKVETHPKPKRQVIDESEKSSDGNNESIIDVLDIKLYCWQLSAIF